MKKVLSLVLALVMLISAFVINATAAQLDTSELSYEATDKRCISLDDAVKAYEEENGVELETYRNYFYIPDGSESFFYFEEVKVPTWYNEYYSDICIWYNSFMCENAPSPVSYCGYSINKTEVENVYYADIPVGVESFIINNGVESKDKPIYSACSSPMLGPEEQYGGEGVTYHDNMIFVLDEFDRASMSMTAYFYGDWYYYSEDGCYIDEDGKCVNPEHDHYQKSVKEAIKEYEVQTGDKVETNRYYFLMPNGKNGEKGDDPDSIAYDKYTQSWYNEYTYEPAVFWWETGTFDPYVFPGYTLEKDEANSVFYADVPKDVKQLMWSNNVKISFDTADDPMYDYLMRTVEIGCQYYDPDESNNYPEGVDSFDNMIFVVDPDVVVTGELSAYKNPPLGGEWYYYYGDGCYGIVKDGTSADCIRDDHRHKYRDKFITEYELQRDMNTLDYYDEIYYHYDADGDVDWALIQAYTSPFTEAPCSIILNDSKLITQHVGYYAFTFTYGIYDVQKDKFIDIAGVDFSEYDGLGEYVDKHIGRWIGDADLDGELTILDATFIQMALAQMCEFSPDDELDYGRLKYLSDFDRDGDRTVMDATAIQMKLAKID